MAYITVFKLHLVSCTLENVTTVEAMYLAFLAYQVSYRRRFRSPGVVSLATRVTSDERY